MSSLSDIFLKKSAATVKPRNASKQILWFLKNLFLAGVSAIALAGTATHYFPDIASRRLDDHMKKNGLPRISQNYTKQNIRVLKDNAFAKFALAEFAATRISNQRENAQKLKNLIHGKDYDLTVAQKIVSPFRYGMSYLFSLYASNVILNEKEHDPFGSPEAYPSGDFNMASLIAPPKNISVESIASILTKLPIEKILTNLDTKKLAHVLYASIMCHEARHCDQDASVSLHEKESDADIHALRTLRTLYPDARYTDWVKKFWLHGRVIAAVSNFDTHHYSSPSLAAGYYIHPGTLGDIDQISLLSQTICLAIPRNVIDNPMAIPPTLIMYYTTKELMAQNVFDREYPGLKKPAQQFLESIKYFDTISGSTLLANSMDEDYVRTALRRNLVSIRPELAPAHGQRPGDTLKIKPLWPGF